MIAVLAAMVSCNDDPANVPELPEPPGPTDKVSVELLKLDVTTTSVSFRITPANAERVAWVCRPASEKALTAEELLAEGTQGRADAVSEAKAEGLQPETDYLVQAVAVAGDRTSEIALLKVTTLGEEVEWILLTDTPVAGAYQLEAGADKSARYAFTLSTGDTTTDNLDGIIAGGAGAYVFTVELYAAACEDPNNPRIPEGTYTFDGHPLTGGPLTEGSANPAASAISYWVDARDAEWHDYPAAGSTVTVTHTAGGYVVTLSVDEHFGRDDEGRRHLDARYEGEIPLKRNLAYDAITDPVTTSFTGVDAVYMGDFGTPGHDNFQMDFYDGTPDEQGNLHEGNLLRLDMYMPLIEDRTMLYLAEGTYIFDYDASETYLGRGAIVDFFGSPMVFGTSWRVIDPEKGQRLGLITEGQLEVNRTGGYYYSITFDFRTQEGVSLKGTYEGKIDPIDNALDRPASPFTEDFHLDYGSDAYAELSYWGNKFDVVRPTTGTGFLYLTNPSTQEGALFTLNMPLADGCTLSEGTYRLAPEGDNNTDFTYRAGKVDGDAYGSFGYVHYKDEDLDVMDQLAPARGGEITISKEGVEYLVEWSLTDDAYQPNTVSGSFRGKLASIKDWSIYAAFGGEPAVYRPDGPRVARSREALERILNVRTRYR